MYVKQFDLTYNDYMEETIFINGGRKLVGEVSVNASKNAFLPIMAGCILCDEQVCLKNYVHISDLALMREILGQLNVSSVLSRRELVLDMSKLQNNKLSHVLTQKMRASIFLLGPMLARFRSAVIAYPGGCKIGTRPIDIHIKSFKSLGAKIIEKHGYLFCNGENLKAGDVTLDFPSVGATESLMMCCVLLKGRSVLRNVAKEPEIVDLEKFLQKMGAKISGAGGDYIVIDGVDKLHGCDFSVMPDRVVAGTYILAVATCGGDALIHGAIAEHNETLLAFLRQSACNIDIEHDKIRIRVGNRLPSIEKIQTMPYPHFPTDLQSQMLVLQSVCKGNCVLKENLFESRFGIVPELIKMGANIVLNGNTAYIQGVEDLFGADVFATDLRAGAGLIIAGLKAEGYTTIHNPFYIDRGYEDIEQKLRYLGAEIKRREI